MKRPLQRAERPQRGAESHADESAEQSTYVVVRLWRDVLADGPGQSLQNARPGEHEQSRTVNNDEGRYGVDSPDLWPVLLLDKTAMMMLRLLRDTEAAEPELPDPNDVDASTLSEAAYLHEQWQHRIGAMRMMLGARLIELVRSQIT